MSSVAGASPATLGPEPGPTGHSSSVTCITGGEIAGAIATISMVVA
jgi:hypothetical protein